MQGYDFYRITGPIKWAGVPKYFSYSSLTAIERCPLQWQLANSSYTPTLRSFPERPTPAAVEGNIVHSILDKLFKALSLIGLPEFGTPKFKECVEKVDIKQTVGILIAEHEDKISKHPRGNGFRLRSTIQQLTNQVIRLFKNQYCQVTTGNSFPTDVTIAAYNGENHGGHDKNPAQLIDKYNALTECRIGNGDISFFGIIDLVWKDGGEVTIVDFKTGKKNDNHIKQVGYYAVLWAKETGVVPSRIEVRYPQYVETISLSQTLLTKIEEELLARISAASTQLINSPAETTCGTHCVFCDVRQFCDKYWQKKNHPQVNNGKDKAPIDIELSVACEPTEYGFEAETNNGERVAVVYDPSLRKILGPFNKNDQCRILSAKYMQDPLSIELKPWSEVFFRFHK
ncbi:MAG: PD-(D/E)XK nuclease family protein [Proteobacteria bacterium]|nr:PD-(D/E)XK nuclease family protein [Pseudomonadota bacterium]MBU1648347.1 PD-(D/E)XK nuclease family protein [Pseudomonadota bacterium]